MLLVVKCGISCWLMMVSKSLAMMGRSEIGRKLMGRWMLWFLARGMTFVTLKMSG